jgi:mannose-6-phosphate isomerase-like protein (cupin superfamily)
MSEPTSRPQAKAFRYEKPEFEGGKRAVRLGRTDRMLANLQVVKQGGENELHSHRHLDGFWMVIRGHARFYGEGNALLGDFGPYEGIVIPRGFPYWFESTGGEDLEILQVEAFDIPIQVRDEQTLRRERISHEDLKPNEDWLTSKARGEA